MSTAPGGDSLFPPQPRYSGMVRDPFHGPAGPGGPAGPLDDGALPGPGGSDATPVAGAGDDQAAGLPAYGRERCGAAGDAPGDGLAVSPTVKSDAAESDSEEEEGAPECGANQQQLSIETSLQQSLEALQAQIAQVERTKREADPRKARQQLALLQRAKVKLQHELSDLQSNRVANSIRGAIDGFRDRVHSNMSQWMGIPTLQDELQRALRAMPAYDENWGKLAAIDAPSKTSLLKKLASEESAAVDELVYEITQSDKGLDANMKRMQEMLHHLERFAEDADPSVSRRRPSVAQRKEVMGLGFRGRGRDRICRVTLPCVWKDKTVLPFSSHSCVEICLVVQYNCVW